MKPALTWTIAGTCLLLLTAAMAWATWSLVGMEGTRQRMEREAVVQERMRLALWRMESVAASLVVEESARPPEQYAPVPEGRAVTPTPAESRVWLHFEMDPDGRVHSPEVPEGPARPAIPDESALRLQELRGRLLEKATPEQWAGLRLNFGGPGTTEGDNRAWMAEANSLTERLWEEEPPPETEAGPAEAEGLVPAEPHRQAAAPSPTADPPQQQEYAPVQVASALKPAEAKREQDNYNKKDAGIRTKVFNSLTRSSVQQWIPSGPDSADSQSQLAQNTRNRGGGIADQAPMEKAGKDVAKSKHFQEPVIESPDPGVAMDLAALSPSGGVDSDGKSPTNVTASRSIQEPPPVALELTPPLTAADPPAAADKSLSSLTPHAPSDPPPALTPGPARKSLLDGLMAPPAPHPADAKMSLGLEVPPPSQDVARSAPFSPAVSPADSQLGDKELFPAAPLPAATKPQVAGTRSLQSPVVEEIIKADGGTKSEIALRSSQQENVEFQNDLPAAEKSQDRISASQGFAGGRGLTDPQGLGGSETPGANNPSPGLRIFSSRPAVGRTVSDFRALWIRDALFLTRRVTADGLSSIQGAWVDWPKLRASLLGTVSDLFPSASLEPAPAGVAGGTDLLASLPVRFLPGPLTFPTAPFWTPLKLSLATAWFCVLLAISAVLLVLRGMMQLSDRRASFVSAVTHELRTPLATFKLYSEMLADGMIKEEKKRQQYLEILTTEADRLGHLVENVLSYSRLENGKVPSGRAPMAVRDLLHRLGGRLIQRVEQAGAEWQVTADSLPDDFSLTTDPAAVEQILFNLVDNACKYARRDGAAARVELDVRTVRGKVLFAVRDYGPGIRKSESKRLFRPFHKSARAAAHTAPGVGLGLALCRRLARDLGGTLEPDHTWPHGACFVLRLPT